jgi:hypothetical protein
MVYKGITSTVDPSKIKIDLQPSDMGSARTAPPTVPGAPPNAQEEQKEENDAAKSLQDQFNRAPAGDGKQ